MPELLRIFFDSCCKPDENSIFYREKFVEILILRHMARYFLEIFFDLTHCVTIENILMFKRG